jgi:hypothetical protein
VPATRWQPSMGFFLLESIERADRDKMIGSA